MGGGVKWEYFGAGSFLSFNVSFVDKPELL